LTQLILLKKHLKKGSGVKEIYLPVVIESRPFTVKNYF